jgi:hypothetical protein
MVSELEKPVRLPGGKKKARDELILGVALPLSIIAVLVFLYFFNPKFKGMVKDLFNVRGAQEEVKPNSAFSIIGQFEDDKGKPVKVKQGFYYVFAVDANGNKQALVTQGTLGSNIDQFSVLVPTTNWADQAKYAVDVTDTPMTAAQLTSMTANKTGAQALGSQAGFNPSNIGLNPVPGSNILVQSVSQV